MSKVELIFDKAQSIPPQYITLEESLNDFNPSQDQLREELDIPNLSELEVIRHYTNLSRNNFGVDNGFYPLGSCTMKYNPKLNERIANIPRFANTHPYVDVEKSQGNLTVLYELQTLLQGITGFDQFSLQPAAGAHGELAGLMIMKSYYKERGENRRKIICPDSSHGTNPASVTMCGFIPVPLKSGPDGLVDIKALKDLLDDEVAGMMLTNPNTLGLFEKDIEKICQLVHNNGSLMYCDGANSNALLGQSRFADMGYDICHLNLHKTFSTPHGGGGPGAGPIGVKAQLVDYLPGPIVKRSTSGYSLYNPLKSIGRMKGFLGNFGILLRAYVYILSQGSDGLKDVTIKAVNNANYLRKKLEPVFSLPFKGLCKHEFVIDDSSLPNGVTTMDVAKRLLDYGFHPPTVYFPLIVHGAMMIEPTETESKETLDLFAEALLNIYEEAKNTPDLVKTAPHTTSVTRFDEVKAARKPILCHCDDWLEQLKES
ncbi:aminomethyl-transferring glycine dehydrogenase subunit GcvPB [Spirochaeta cellobiosiphila]|uniref:aminomethyl-transferring glycine dehydrogenase subunit GcvPB n=1 Tax=Spirochaeta cellobiosiphila TaxID=504483 RepID=UPI00041551B4|nr:aminomethyl-transferring glycine dehydrogenase subunit GcvPB [Spirochaeta cellobiosiphila]